jgi:hypothetical protein
MPTKKTDSLFTESTDVPVSKSIGEILALLVRAGATSINQELEGGKVTGLSFVIPMGAGRIPYKLPVRVDPVFAKLNGRRDVWGKFGQRGMAAKDREQAERVAWRQLYWWLKSQLALIDLGMVQAGEVLMPYMLDREGRTFYEVHGPKLLEAPKGESA